MGDRILTVRVPGHSVPLCRPLCALHAPAVPGAGMQALLQLLDPCHDVNPVRGPLEARINRCRLVAAECLIAALQDPCKQAGCVQCQPSEDQRTGRVETIKA